MFDGGFAKNLHVTIAEGGGYDYCFKSSMHSDNNYGEYLSKMLAESLSVAELRNVFSKHSSTSSKHLKKQDIIDKLE